MARAAYVVNIFVLFRFPKNIWQRVSIFKLPCMRGRKILRLGLFRRSLYVFVTCGISLWRTC